MAVSKKQFIKDYENATAKNQGQTSSVLGDKATFIAEYNKINVPNKVTSTYTQPSIQQSNYDAMQNLFNKNNTRYEEELKAINDQISAISGYGVGADRSNLQKLYQRKNELEKQLKTGRYDENLTALERIQLTGQGIGESYNYAPDVLADTTVQAYKDHKANKGDAEYDITRKSLADVTSKIAGMQYKINNGFANQIDMAEYNRLLNEQAQLDAVMNAKYRTPMDMETDAVKGMQRAMQAQQQATYGMGGTGQFLWNTGASIAENASLMPLAILPGGQALITGMMGARSAAQKAVEVGETGGSANEALFRGLSSGAIEAATEKIPLENLAKIVKNDAGKKILKQYLENGPLREMLINAGKQSLLEGGEESIAYIANYIVDKAAQDPNAEFSLKELALSALGGALSGGVMGAGASVIGENSNKNNINSRNSLQNFNDNVDKVFKGENIDKNIVIGETPQIYTKYGAKNLDLTISPSTIQKMAYPKGYLKGKHNLGIPAVKQIPIQLQNPLAILKSTSQKDSLVVLTEWNDTEGNEVIIPLHLNKQGVISIENEIPSAYGKKNIAALLGDNNENVVYTKNNKAIQTLLSKRLQLPQAVVDDTLVDYNITQSKQNINGNKLQETAENEQLKQEFADLVGVDTRTEPQKVAEEQQVKVDSAVKLYNDKIITEEQAREIIESAKNAVEQAEIRQRAIDGGKEKTLELIDNFAKRIGVKVKLFEGDYKAYGFANDGTMYLNVNDPNVMLKTAVHEAVHLLKTNNQAAYAKLEQRMLALANSKAEGFENFRTEGAKAAIAYKNLVNDKGGLNEEITAKLVEECIDDPETFIQEYGQDKNFIELIKEFIREIKNSINAYITKDERAMLDNAMIALDKYLRKEAGNVKATDADENSINLNISTFEDGGREELVRWLDKQNDMTLDEVNEIIDAMDGIYNMVKKYNTEMAEEYPAFNEWCEAKPKVTEDGRLVMSVIVNNGDYDMNIDVSTVCKKRKTLDAVLNEIARSGKINLFSMTQPDVVKMNNIIKKNGFEVACSMCFVDAKRYRIGNFANDFVDRYNALVESLIPTGSDISVDQFNFTDANIGKFEGKLVKDVSDNELDWTTIDEVIADKNSKPIVKKMAKAIKEDPSMRRIMSSGDIISSKGLDNLKAKNGKLYTIVNGHMGTAKPKLSHSETPYVNEILRANNFAPEAAYAVGGVRIQSFSDYMANMFFDYAQIVADLSAKKLPAHAYTKEADFVKLFGKTGIKINMSLIPKVAEISYEDRIELNKLPMEKRKNSPIFKKMQATAGLDADGNYLWADESFDFDTAIELQKDKQYSKNIGTIAVGVSDAHIWKLLKDDNIRMVIPYHKSGINHIVAAMQNIDAFMDYTNVQNTRYKSSGRKIGKRSFHFDFYADLAKTNDPIKTAENYVKDCEMRGFLPKFDQFAYIDVNGTKVFNKNYYKLLIDFAVYDNGEYTPQGAVKMQYPDNVNDLFAESLKGYEKGQKDLSDKLKGIVDEIYNEIGVKEIPIKDITFNDLYSYDYIRKDNPFKKSIDTSSVEIPEKYKGKTLNEVMDMLVNEYDVIEQGENPAREIQIPKKDMYGKTVSQFARTVAEAEATPEEFANNEIRQAVAEGRMSHEVLTDKEAMDYAEKTITSYGYEESLKQWQAIEKANKAPTKNDIALGQMLYNTAVNAGDAETAMKLVCDLCVQATRAGQTVQAFRLLKKMTPSGKLYMLQKSVNQINKENLERYKKEYEEIKIPTDLADELLNAKTEAEADIAVEKIEQHIADNIKPTIADKLNAWRYLAMLGNPRTHIRNVVGNLAFSPFKLGKDILGAQLEKTIKTGTKTKAVVNQKKDKALIDFALKDYENNVNAIKGEAKYDIKGGIKEKQKVFNTKWLEKVRKGNSNALEAEDLWFLKRHYAWALAGAMKANGITPNTVKNNAKLMEEIKAYAVIEAQKATYRDANRFSNAVVEARKMLSSKGKAVEVVTQGILPFAKTPANVIVRGIEYSPIGAGKATYELIRNKIKGVESGKYTTGELLDQLSAGLTGTAICMLGVLLASWDVVTGKEDKGEKEDDFEKLFGVQDYAIKIGNSTYTLDWAAPAAMPFFVGVELFNAFKDEDSTTGLLTALQNISGPVFEMSMLDGLNNAIENTAYSNSNGIIALAEGSAYSYAGQFVPTLGGQVARTGNKYRTQTYVDKNKNIPASTQRFIQQQQAKVPGLNNMLPTYRDQWGNKQDNGNVVERAFQNFVSPGYVSKDKSTAVDDEIKRIYEQTGETSVLPSYANKSYKENGEQKNLTAKEYDEYAQVKGQTAYNAIEELLNNPIYKMLDDAEKVKVIEKAYEYANDKAKAELNDSKVSGNQTVKMDKDTDYIAGYGAALALKPKADTNNNGSISAEEAVAYINKLGLTKSQKAILFECMCPTVKNNPYK